MSKYSDDCREEHIEESKMNKSKAISAVLAFVIAAMTLIGLAFSLVVVEFEYEWFEEVVGIRKWFSTSHIYKRVYYGRICVGDCRNWYFMSFPAVCVAGFHDCNCCLCRQEASVRLSASADFFDRLSCLQFLYMLEGITYSSITDATYPDHVSAHTLAYIPFLIETVLFVVYLIYVKNSNHPMQQVADSAMESGARFERNVNGAIYRLDGGMVKVLYVYGDHLTLQATEKLAFLGDARFLSWHEGNLLFGYSRCSI